MLLLSSDNYDGVASIGTDTLHRALAGGEKVNVFGALNEINPFQTTLAFMIIIGAVIVIDLFFDRLHDFTNDTIFQGIVTLIEKELMTVGLMAFIFKILLYTTDFIPKDWLIPLEVADIVIPIASFIYCLQGFFLILHSIYQCDVYSKAYHLHVIEILSDYYRGMKKWYNKSMWLPLSTINQEIEFKVYHIIFCDFHSIQKAAFPFDQYIAKVYLKYLYGMIRIETTDWITIIILLLINWGRLKLKLFLIKHPSYYDTAAQDIASIKVYVVVGYIILAITLFQAYISRSIQLRILANHGIASVDDYPIYLKSVVIDTNADTKVEEMRLNADDLLSAIAKMKLANALEEHKKENQSKNYNVVDGEMLSFRKKLPMYIYNTCITGIKNTINYLHLYAFQFKSEPDESEALRKKAVRVRQTLIEDVEQYDKSHPLSNSSDHSDHKGTDVKDDNTSVVGGNDEGDVTDCDNDSPNATDKFKGVMRKNSFLMEMLGVHATSSNSRRAAPTLVSLSNGQKANRKIAITNDYMSSESVVSAAALAAASIGLTRSRAANSDDGSLLSVKSTITKEKLSNLRLKMNIQSCYLFGKPELYFNFVEALNIVISFYLSLYLTNYIQMISTLSDTYHGWFFIALAPGALSAIVYIYIVNCSVLLRAVTYLDSDAVKETIEEVDDIKSLGKQMRDKILAKLHRDHEDVDASNELKKLFESINNDDDSYLSRQELAAFLLALGIQYSKKRWKQIFRDIDVNFDDQISYDEFYSFIFPESDILRTKEARRIKRLKDRLRRDKLYSSLNDSMSIPYSMTLRCDVPTACATATATATAGHRPLELVLEEA